MGLEGRHPRVQVAVLDGLGVVRVVGLEQQQRVGSVVGDAVLREEVRVPGATRASQTR